MLGTLIWCLKCTRKECTAGGLFSSKSVLDRPLPYVAWIVWEIRSVHPIMKWSCKWKCSNSWNFWIMTNYHAFQLSRFRLPAGVLFYRNYSVWSEKSCRICTEALYKRINWLELQHLNVVMETRVLVAKVCCCRIQMYPALWCFIQNFYWCFLGFLRSNWHPVHRRPWCF